MELVKSSARANGEINLSVVCLAALLHLALLPFFILPMLFRVPFLHCLFLHTPFETFQAAAEALAANCDTERTVVSRKPGRQGGERKPDPKSSVGVYVCT